MNVCRACLKKGEDLLDFKGNEDIVEAFFDLAQITIPSNEKWPLAICDQCLMKLKEFREFRRQIIVSSNFFDKLPLIESVHSGIFTPYFIKDETDELPALDDEFCNEAHDAVKSTNEHAGRGKRKLKKSKKQTVHVSRTPRKLVEVDPAKITVLTLSKEEQIREQQAEGLKPSYLNKPYKCDKCFKGFNYERKLQSHCEKYHQPSSPHTCDVCSRTMVNTSSLAIHLKKHQLIYQCNACFLRFVEKPRAILHYQSAHEGVQPQYSCKHCGKVFSNPGTLVGHQRRRHQPESTRPQCNECHKRFATKDSLLDHMLIHTGEKSYPCKVCDKRFRLRQAVEKHMLSHSSLRVHYCARCDVSFKFHASLASHLRHAAAHTPPSVLAKAKLENTCEQCGRSFARRQGLASHLSRHAGRRRVARSAPRDTRYVCHQCGRGFAARRTLDNHVLAHAGARPHACPQCDARFTQRATLRAHLARLHGVKTVPKVASIALPKETLTAPDKSSAD